MLKRPLHLLYVIRTAAYINLRVLRILHTQAIASALIMALPALRAFLKVFAAPPYGESNVLVIELRPIQLKEVNQVLA